MLEIRYILGPFSPLYNRVNEGGLIDAKFFEHNQVDIKRGMY